MSEKKMAKKTRKSIIIGQVTSYWKNWKAHARKRWYLLLGYLVLGLYFLGLLLYVESGRFVFSNTFLDLEVIGFVSLVVLGLTQWFLAEKD